MGDRTPWTNPIEFPGEIRLLGRGGSLSVCPGRGRHRVSGSPSPRPAARGAVRRW
jgi:hypothetical protein